MANTTLADITSADWSLMLDQNTPSRLPGSGIGNVVQGVADINQCIEIILSTPQGSDPLRPTFACDIWRWLDSPIQIARAHIVSEIVTAITKWEPRVRILSVIVNLVSPDSSGNANAHLNIAITWQLAVNVTVAGVSQSAQQLTITVPRNFA